MYGAPDDPQLSTMEELDPEPSAGGGRVHVREWIVGLLLLVGVAVWAGWTWWHQSVVEASYQAGAQAEMQRNWEAAQTAFKGASGYKDADTRADNAVQQIAQRDRQYDLAKQSIAALRFAEALKAAQQVERIQPHYRDTLALEELATGHVYDLALRWAIARRRGPDGAALYYRDSREWVKLQDSDAQSALVGSGPPGVALYDVPHTDAEVPPGAPYDRKAVPSRRLRAVRLQGDNLTYSPLSLPFVFNSRYYWGSKGAWLLSPIDNDAREGGRPGLREGFGQLEVVYEAYDSPITSTLALPNDDWALVDLSPGGDHVLLADLSAFKGPAPATSLYVADGDGRNPHLLYTHEGGIQRAIFSPDGQSVLLFTYRIVSDDQTLEEESAILLHLDGSPSQVLAKTTARIGPPYLPSISATFVTHGANYGNILLAQQEDERTTFMLLDSTSPDAPILGGQVSKLDLNWGEVWVEDGEEPGSLVIAWRSSPPSAGLQLVLLDAAGGSAHQVPEFESSRQVFAMGAATNAGTLLYSLAEGPSGNIKLYGVSLSALADGKATSQLLVSAKNGSSLYHKIWPFHAGSGLFAYVDGRELHASTYDRSVDVALEKGFITLMDDGFLSTTRPTVP